MAKDQYWLGVALTAGGVVILSPDALLFRLLDSSLWTAAFWRLFLMGCAVSLIVIVTKRGRLPAELKAIGWALIPAALCMGVSNLGFVFALTHTSVADTLAILATAPVFAAFFAILLGETPPLRTWVAAGVIAIGIWVIFDASFGLDAWKGNLAALTVAICAAIYFTICRLRQTVDMTPALALSALLSAGVAAAMADTLIPPASDWPPLLALGLFVMPVSLTLITLGPRRLPVAEVSLLMLLETALGPLWVWLALGETPSRATLFGGGLILSALIAHGLAAWREQRSRNRAFAAEFG